MVQIRYLKSKAVGKKEVLNLISQTSRNIFISFISSGKSTKENAFEPWKAEKTILLKQYVIE